MQDKIFELSFNLRKSNYLHTTKAVTHKNGKTKKSILLHSIEVRRMLVLYLKSTEH